MDTRSYDEMIGELSEICDIVPEYYDIFGRKKVTSLETQKAILKAMNMKLDSPEEIKQEIEERRERPWKTFVEPVKVISENEQPLAIPVYVPVGEGEERRLTLSWSLKDERGERVESVLSGDAVSISEQHHIDGIRYAKINLLEEKRLNIGYYEMDVQCIHPDPIFQGGKNRLQKKVKVIIAPDACYLPPELQEGKTWGLSINLYSIASRRNWGIGDFGDLAEIVRGVADLKGGFVGINPLHLIANTRTFGTSPYSPITKLYKNFIYLSIEKIPEVSESEEIQAIIRSGSFKRELSNLKREKLIDYEKIASLKEEILRRAFTIFYERHYAKDTPRGKDFKKYVSEEGSALESFALFMALREQMKKMHDAEAWQQWPEAYYHPLHPAVQEFKKTHVREMLFYPYVQWLVEKQHEEIAELTEDLGMSVGLYHDLAIGSIGGGSDVWCYQDMIAGDVDVGAPPDDYSINGQDWGFPPLIPEKLKERGYEFFVHTIGKNMKYGGALRIDHALGLFRLFWIPKGMAPKDGAYVRYPSEDLLRIIALESVRNRTVVIAEDLGTIGENVREALKKFHMLSYRLFYFERDYPDPSFLSPERYPEMALCAVTTHDLPTLYGYWIGQDLKTKKKLGMYPDHNIWQQQVNERERDKELILSALKSHGILPDGNPSNPKRIPRMTPELCLAIYRYLAKTPCKLILVSLDDIMGTLNQQNMPATVDSYPNWIQKTPLTLEETLSDRRFSDLSEVFAKR